MLYFIGKNEVVIKKVTEDKHEKWLRVRRALWPKCVAMWAVRASLEMLSDMS